jgi:hypothetical protein
MTEIETVEAALPPGLEQRQDGLARDHGAQKISHAILGLEVLTRAIDEHDA